MAMVATPIFINIIVVFVRLYWFERRFQNIVREARNFRRTRSRSRSKSEAKDVPDVEFAERGVKGRNIVVLRDNQDAFTHDINEMGEKSGKISPNADSSSDDDIVKPLPNEADISSEHTVPLHREVTFADEVKQDDDVQTPLPRFPKRLSPEEHIAFVERQRRPDKQVLRIPGPRESDRGDLPEAIDDDDPNAIQDTTSPILQKRNRSGTQQSSLRFNRNVTIDSAENPRIRGNTGLTNRPKLDDVPTEALKDAETEEKLPLSARLKARTGTFSSMLGTNTTKEKEPMPYLSWQPTIGRNSAFVDLTEEQREELGGIEYRSLKTLAIVLCCYYFFFHLLGVICLLPWIIRTDTWGAVVDAAGISRAWWGIFTPASLFNDLGFTLTPDSMLSFQKAVLVLLLGSFLIIIGNTGFPCMLRLVIYIIHKVIPTESGLWEELKFLLDHPRRCFTLLFPSQATWWLLGILVALNGLDIIFFIILDLKDPVVTSLNPDGFRFLNGLFQAASTRTAGFSSVSLSDLHPGIQVSYLIMMYISVFPIAISVRRTNVYEEKSLGIYGSTSEEADDSKEPSYIGAHLRRQLSFDLWYIFFGLFFIAIIEGNRLQNINEPAFTIFSCLFEIVSAYGTVGLSLGYPDTDPSFSAQFKVLSKLIIAAMMIRGRHRGLPYELDRAILLPSDALHKKEAADAAARVRRNSSHSNLDHAAAPTGGLQRGPTFPRRDAASATTSSRDHALSGAGGSGGSGAGGEHGHHGGGHHQDGSLPINPHARHRLGKIMSGLAAGPRAKEAFRHGSMAA